MANLDYGQHFTAHHITTVKDAGTTMTVENTQGSGTQQTKITRALISVYDKTGLEDLARGLAKAGVEIVSTGSTAKVIADAGVEVTPVENVTEFPECFDGRVKTLHPRVHGGILADRTKQKHRDQLNELGIAPFDLVVVNLYPFEETVASGANVQECIEKIDIGGPAMVRAAAKNHDSVAVVVDPANYDELPLVLDLAWKNAVSSRWRHLRIRRNTIWRCRHGCLPSWLLKLKKNQSLNWPKMFQLHSCAMARTHTRLLIWSASQAPEVLPMQNSCMVKK